MCFLAVSYCCYEQSTAVVCRCCVHQLSNQQLKEKNSEEIRPLSEWVSRSNWYCIKKLVLGWIILLVFLENIPSYACLEMYGFICMDNLIFYLYAYSEFFLLISWHIGVINGWKQRSAICKEKNFKNFKTVNSKPSEDHLCIKEKVIVLRLNPVERNLGQWPIWTLAIKYHSLKPVI